jgi:hypothetical protein
MNTRKVKIQLPESANGSHINFRLFFRINRSDARECSGIGVLHLGQKDEKGSRSVHITSVEGPGDAVTGTIRQMETPPLGQPQADLIHAVPNHASYKYECIEEDQGLDQPSHRGE